MDARLGREETEEEEKAKQSQQVGFRTVCVGLPNGARSDLAIRGKGPKGGNLRLKQVCSYDDVLRRDYITGERTPLDISNPSSLLHGHSQQHPRRRPLPRPRSRPPRRRARSLVSPQRPGRDCRRRHRSLRFRPPLLPARSQRRLPCSPASRPGP